MKKLMLIALGAGLLLGGCSSDEPEATPAAPPTIELSAAQSRAAADMEAFNLKIFRLTNSNKKPADVVVCSPVQTLIAYSMHSYLGRQTDYLQGLIGCDDQEALNELSHTYLTTLPTLDSKVKFEFSSLWTRPQGDTRAEIEKVMREYYGADVMDFDPEEFNENLKKRVADWHLAHNCPDYFLGYPDFGTPHEEIYFTNDFEGEWALAFDESKTTSAKFNMLDGTTVDMKLMHAIEMPGRIMVTQNYAAAAIDLGAGAYEAIFVLPAEATVEGINNLIDSNALEEVLATDMEPTKLDIALPRTDCYGLTLLYKTDAETTVSTGKVNPILSSIEFSEKGAKSHSLNAASGLDHPMTIAPCTIPIVFDRPFLAFIRLKQTGICLAAVKVMHPSCSQRDQAYFDAMLAQ